MVKAIIEIDSKQIESAIDQLSPSEKLRIVRKLERETRRNRWSDLISRINYRCTKNPITEKEIFKVCEETRQKRYERSSKGRY
ncbi:MAG: hypothetical protein ABIJ40_11625 [Bacteroidota bacterium]